MSNRIRTERRGTVESGLAMDRETSRAFGKYLSLSTLLPAATCTGYAIGLGIDTLFGTRWIRFLFLGLGAVAGFISLVRELDDRPGPGDSKPGDSNKQ